MIRMMVALLGLAVFGAVFAGIYYSPQNLELKEKGAPAFNLAPGEAEQTTLQPALAGSPIHVQVKTIGAIDLYVMEKEWSDTLPEGGRLLLDGPFSYDAAHSLIGLEGEAEFTFLSDGLTTFLMVMDNSDNFYLNDTAPDVTSPTSGQASVQITIRYLEEEQRSLVFGYLATVPSILLVVVTLVRKLWHSKR